VFALNVIDDLFFVSSVYYLVLLLQIKKVDEWCMYSSWFLAFDANVDLNKCQLFEFYFSVNQ